MNVVRPLFRLACGLALPGAVFAASQGQAAAPAAAAELYPLSAVRLLESPFSQAVRSNRDYLLAHDVDRLLAPFLREAGLPKKAETYGNWESGGLDGHTAGHYLSALAMMVAAHADTADGELSRRLDYMLAELARCQAAGGDGYLGGVPRSRALWADVKAGKINAHGFGLNDRWVPLYNIHKTFAGLRDAHRIAGREQARGMWLRLGEWWLGVTADLTAEQIQQMLRSEHGGMNEAMADLHALSGDSRYLTEARRLNHKAVLDPLIAGEDRLTGLHANTQIPKVIGLERIAGLTGDAAAHRGATFFWDIVTRERSVAFGGNSVGEHFQPKENFRPILESREGPETCNTYNMLKLTEHLFVAEPRAAYADYYERALYNHILASIHPTRPGYVYFTPIRPEHYRVYSDPGRAFWCCVGSGMENPGKYGEFIYARAADGIYVNLFVPSELTFGEGFRLRQTTRFPDEQGTRLELTMPKSSRFALRLRHPAWVDAGEFAVRVNGRAARVDSTPSSYAELLRDWKNGDVVEIALPMRTRAERLPDGGDWVALLHGPVLLAASSGKDRLDGLVADDSRMGHVAHGPVVPFDRVPVIFARPEEIPALASADEKSPELRVVLKNAVDTRPEGLELRPFFRTHDERYQIYWQLTSREEHAARRERLAAEERAKAELEAATLDRVAIGEQQPEVEHGFRSEGSNTGIHQGRRWRDGRWFEYTLDTRGEKAAELVVAFWGGDTGRVFDILVDGAVLATVRLDAERPGEFVEKRFPIPAEMIAKARDGRITVRFAAKTWVAGGVFDLRLMKARAAGAGR